MRANQDKIGMPGYGRFDDGLSSVPYFNSSPYTEPRSTQLIRDSLQQYKSQLLLIFQLRSVPRRHFRRRQGLNRHKHVQSQNLCILSPKLGNKSANQILGELRIVDSHQDFHDSSFSTRSKVRNHGRGTPAQIQHLGAASFSLNLNIYVVSIKRPGAKSRSQLLVIENLEREIGCSAFPNVKPRGRVFRYRR